MTLWLISDTHFSHASMIFTFKLANGEPARNFNSVEEMDELMIENWNACVKISDHVYHVGDVAMTQHALDTVMPRLHGHKRLVRGNHDICKTKHYARYFKEIYGVRVLDQLIMSHYPIHPESLKEGWINVHGHTHMNHVRLPDMTRDTRYVNICVEQTGYRPITLEEARAGKWHLTSVKGRYRNESVDDV